MPSDVVDMLAAMRQLPANQREVLVLHYLVKLSLDEVARHLGIPGGPSGAGSPGDGAPSPRRSASTTAGRMSVVLDDRLRQQLARAAEHGAGVVRPPEPAAIRRRSRARRWRRAAVAAAAACASPAAWSSPAPTARLSRPDLPVPLAPASFLAQVDGRVAVVSTASGKAVRYLTKAPAGQGQFFFALSEDGDTVWFSDVDVCGHSGIYRVPYQGGVAVRVDRSANAEALTVSQDGSKLVYRPLGCDGAPPSPAFAVLDRRLATTPTPSVTLLHGTCRPSLPPWPVEFIPAINLRPTITAGTAGRPSALQPQPFPQRLGTRQHLWPPPGENTRPSARITA
jgi:hypothetical protein